MDSPDLDLPRSVALALWLQDLGPASAADPAPVARLVSAVQGDDEPHAVVSAPDTAELGSTLAELVDVWAGGARIVAAALPAPGDPAGVPAAIGQLAAAAGECLLVATGARSYAAIPRVEEFGSVYEPGHLVRWEVVTVPEWQTGLIGQVGSLADAERDLRTALTQATRALAALDVARWRPDAAEAIASLRSDGNPGWRLPRGVDARRVRVLASAARLRAIVALATADDGGAVNLWQADQRSTALREVDRAARRAMSAATLPAPDPDGRGGSSD
ncbi:hypothetical protein DDP54_17030 (plasmid) [Cellulomonas sp. WB94]|uniref:hypothetical protein n=1 Tax=Cellulomonas sp. WB94 TaxID=2173174 RepID=UPI000D57C95F|nr:hypothetical protein [Cellulomonas sp. WB94]PVU81250.1 hypothetical protein DDP54_17030 [Cellulomonas sp. WB94]